MVRMNSFDSDDRVAHFTCQGTPISFKEMEAYRLKKGLCALCGLRCYKKTFQGKIPITKPGLIYDGRCLKCNPIRPEERIDINDRPGARLVDKRNFNSDD